MYNIKDQNKYLASFLLGIWCIPFSQSHFPLSANEKHKMNLRYSTPPDKLTDGTSHLL